MSVRAACAPILLALLGALGCAQAAGPVAPALDLASLEGSPALFVEAEGSLAPVEALAAPSCGPQLHTRPTELFGHRVELRLPAGLDPGAVEAGSLARWSAQAEGCGPRLGAELAILTYSARTAGPTPLAEWQHRVFEALELPHERELELVAGDLEGDDATMMLSFPDDLAWDDTRVYLRVVERDGRVVALAYMSSRRDWDRLAPTVAASTASLILRAGA